jgi:hypothetical protein
MDAPILDYANPASAPQSPMLGRLSSCLLLLFGISFGVLAMLGNYLAAVHWEHISEYWLLSILGVGTLVSLMAVIRLPSRTTLAWISLALWIGCALFMLLLFFA